MDKEELKSLLENYKGILNKEMLDYLNGLIELEYSALKENISLRDRTSLRELKIYKEAFIYNIYTRAYNLFKKEIPDIKRFLGTFYIDIEKESLSLCRFVDDDKLRIEVNEYVENPERRSIEIERLKEIIKILDSRVNPYPLVNGCGERLYGNLSLVWDKELNREISYNQELLRRLENYELNEIDKRKIMLTSKCLEILLNEYDLKREDFKEEKQRGTYMEDNARIVTPTLNMILTRKYL